ncbi:hypothetical protein KEJ37_05440 [Candidatus Bathyarchaeota archaeon]|nr:hypothetical protein [Candidatus Bathyarchaeota archaeon]
MLTTADIITAIVEEEICNIKSLSKKLEIPLEKLEKILIDLGEHDLVEYNQQTGEVKPSHWLADLSREVENLKPTTGTIILSRNQEIRLQDITIGNFTDADLELNVKIGAKQKEIAICKLT